MTTLLYQPYLTRKEDPFNDLFYRFFDDCFSKSTPIPHKLSETDTTITLTIDVPGFEKSDIAIDYENEILSIHAKSSQENHRSEINQSFKLPGIEFKKSSASLTHGVLNIQLEKSPQRKKQQLKIS